MWLLLVAIGSGCLARCWQAGRISHPEEEEAAPPAAVQEDRDRQELEQERDRSPCCSEERENKVLDSRPPHGIVVEAMLKRKEKNALQQMDPVVVARRLSSSSKKLFDEEDDRSTSPKVADSNKSTDARTTTATTTIDQGGGDSSSGPAPVMAAKRMIEFSKHSMHEDDGVAIDVKRKRDCCSSDQAAAQEQGRLSAFTCSYMDNPGLTELWFGPRDGDGGDGSSRIRKARTLGRTRSRVGVGRRVRYLRSSPGPVSSLDSCLSAQLHFDEDKKVSRSLVFQPFEEGRSTGGLREVELLGAGAAVGAAYKNFARLPALVKPSLRRNPRNKRGDSSQEALLFSFGIGIGVMHMISSNNAELDKLRRCLKDSEDLIHALQQKDLDSDSARTGLTPEQLRNMDELEAQLEAELELMQLNSTEEELDAEVVQIELSANGLPGASDFEADDRNHSRGDGRAANWAVSPRELDRRLRMVIEARQEERIAELEQELHHAETQLQDREMELQVWKDRVVRLTGTPDLSLSGTIARNDPTGCKGKVSQEDEDGIDRGKSGEQSLTDDICDEFLKSVDVRIRRQNSGIGSTCSISDCGESWPRPASGTTPENLITGIVGKEEPGEGFQHNRSSSTDLEQDQRKATPPWSCSSFIVSHAGSTTPIEDVRSSKLFNTPRTLRVRNGALVLDKIRYWENVARGSAAGAGANTPPEQEEEESHGQEEGNGSPPLRFSCSEGSSRDESSGSDREEQGGHGLIKRIVEKSRRGSTTLLKDVERMLAALDTE